MCSVEKHFTRIRVGPNATLLAWLLVDLLYRYIEFAALIPMIQVQTTKTTEAEISARVMRVGHTCPNRNALTRLRPGAGWQDCVLVLAGRSL
jgi:hypothetical protein